MNPSAEARQELKRSKLPRRYRLRAFWNRIEPYLLPLAWLIVIAAGCYALSLPRG